MFEAFIVSSVILFVFKYSFDVNCHEISRMKKKLSIYSLNCMFLRKAPCIIVKKKIIIRGYYLHTHKCARTISRSQW